MNAIGARIVWIDRRESTHRTREYIVTLGSLPCRAEIRQQSLAVRRQSVLLLAAPGFVGDRHFQPVGLKQRFQYEFGAITSVHQWCQLGYCLFRQTVMKNLNLMPTRCHLRADQPLALTKCLLTLAVP